MLAHSNDVDVRIARRDVLRGVAAWSAERSAMEDLDVGSKKRKSPRTPKAGWTTVRVKGETPKKEKHRSIAVFEWIKMQVTGRVLPTLRSER